MKIDFKSLNTKEKFLQYMQENLEDMYSLNYDALIDSISAYKNLELELLNIDSYENVDLIIEIFEIIKNNYSYIKIKGLKLK